MRFGSNSESSHILCQDGLVVSSGSRGDAAYPHGNGLRPAWGNLECWSSLPLWGRPLAAVVRSGSGARSQDCSVAPRRASPTGESGGEPAALQNHRSCTAAPLRISLNSLQTRLEQIGSGHSSQILGLPFLCRPPTPPDMPSLEMDIQTPLMG